MNPFIYILVGLAGALLGAFMMQRRASRSMDTEALSKQVSHQLADQLSQYLHTANSQLVLMADEKLKAEKQAISSDLTSKKEAIEQLIKRVMDDLSLRNAKLEQFENSRIQNFTELKKEIENSHRLTEQLSATTDSLRQILSNNQMRGQFGEQVAEDLLKMSGFVKGTDYQYNKAQSSSQTRPDFTIFLPNGTRINVDVKFPYSDLQRATECNDPKQKQEHLKKFEQAIKEKIKQCSSRDYINPTENTVDFVILFIPNEMIFSFIYDKMNDAWLAAMKSKVVLAGPFSFTAILRLIRQAHETFAYQKNTLKIIEHIKMFESEFVKYNDEFLKLGSRIQSVSSQFERVNTTRTNQLMRTIDRIKLAEPDTASQIGLLDGLDETPETS